MSSLRPLTVQAEHHLLRWRTRRGRPDVIRYLDLLTVAVQARGYRCVKLYEADDLPTQRPPVLWVFTFGPADHVCVADGLLKHRMFPSTW
ncbi:hypothetical protein [Actinomadura sp. 7K507]|uniref:hypothetical protein n=1 Tax=Actinomadura sp. 7K507 TaxID=2530365 RepID=UPI001048E551|nr:hypothetical protein [Actinomadura sp. 7K507]TDC84779.1 hypothetical protein E1285_26155 [Actinomadura sp. 7K507]